MSRHYFYTTLCTRIIMLLLVILIYFPAIGQEEWDSTFDSTMAEDSLLAVPPVSDFSTADTAFYFDTPGNPDRKSVEQRRVPDSALQHFYKDDAFWYANANLKREEDRQRASALSWLVQQQWFKTLLWCIIIGSFAFIIIWFLAVSNIGLFRKKPIPADAVHEEVADENIFTLDFENEIGKAAAAKNFRLAIRLMYLQVLKTLDDKNIITYKQEKTNSDYVQQLWNSPFYLNFFRLTRHFEYAWYGQLSISEVAFEQVKKDFITFKQQL